MNIAQFSKTERLKFGPILVGVVWLLFTVALARAEAPTTQGVTAPDGSRRLWVRSEFATAEVWLADGNAPPRRLLSFPGEVIADASWSPDGESVAFIRAPLGSETDALTEVWRLDVAGNRLIRLTQNNLPDYAPHWSADERAITVQQGENIVSLPADHLSVDNHPSPAPQISPLSRAAIPQLTAPAEIRVVHSQYNTCRSAPVGQIDSIPFEEYVKRVVPHEVFPSWATAALQAQAVAARTYAWYHYLQNPAAAWHVTDWVDYQYMCDTTDPRTDAAVDATAGEYLAYLGNPIVAMYSAENSSPTQSNPYVLYLRAVDDPVSFGYPRNGHGYGMGQWGAQRWASQYGWEYTAILRHYYSDVTLKTSAVLTDTAPPKVALVQPWNGFYLTGNRLGVMLNTFDASSIISHTNLYWTTPLTTENILWSSGAVENANFAIAPPVLPDSQLLTGTVVLTAEVFDATGKRAVSVPVRFGVDRSDPTAQWGGGSAVLTSSLALSATISASDETSGVAMLAIGNVDWQWEGETMVRQQTDGGTLGQVISDTTALNGQAVRATVAQDAPGVWTATDIFLPGGQPYRAYFRLKTSDNSSMVKVATLIIWAGSETLGIHDLRGIDFRQANKYQEFGVDFFPPQSGSMTLPFSVSVAFGDAADITLDRFAIFNYPIPFQNTLPPDAPLEARVKVIDGAGNVAADLWRAGFTLRAQVYLPLIFR